MKASETLTNVAAKISMGPAWLFMTALGSHGPESLPEAVISSIVSFAITFPITAPIYALAFLIEGKKK
ncbi:MAG: hypothetical protein KGH64_00585 [Candidatus Micrarchaeota archaeon]|nr:hypothetical protein [Candidatus Micrarchaeota archaeon]